MVRGTTPTYTFFLPLDASVYKTLRIIFDQEGLPDLVKTDSDLTLSGNSVAVTLTQEETFAFSANSPVQIQVRALTLGGDALASNIMTDLVYENIDDGVIMQ